MAELKLHKCKLCGEPLDITKAVGGAVQCGYCGTMYTLPKETADDRLLNFLDSGELSLDKGDFEGAMTSYSKAAEIDGNEPEAHFGKALSKFKVRYIKDEVANRLQPICYEVTDKKFSDDPDYMRAYMKATPEQRAVYEEKAKDIDYIQSEFYNLKQSGLDYDCFICVKVTDDNTKLRTADYKYADDIYFALKKKYKPFFSERELTNVTGADYEARILYALYSSECMLVVCGDEEYLQTKWVKNEYSRFLKLVNDSEKETDSIAIAFTGKPIERLPGRNGKLQGIDLGKLGALSRVEEFVDSHTPAARAKRAAEAEAKKRAAEEQKRELAEQRRALEEQRKAMEEQQRQFAEQLEKIKNAPSGNISYEELAKRIEEQRIAREKEEAERKRQEEERIAREKREKEEAERKKREEEERIKNLGFEIFGTEFKKYTGKGGDVKIPHNVTSIAGSAFRGCTQLKHIIIPISVTSIGAAAFQGCTNLKSITIPEGVTSIGAATFDGCTNLESIIIPDGVTSIGDKAFGGCKKLTDITIPAGVTSIGRGIFERCSSLKSIVIPDRLTYIGDAMFNWCENLTSVTIPNSVTSIGAAAFNNCHSLENIVLPASVTSIGIEAFQGCTSLMNISLPNIGGLGERVFSGCIKLTGITIPESVSVIGSGAFKDCVSLTEITIPKSVTSIGISALENCRGLKSITLPFVGNEPNAPKNKHFGYIFGALDYTTNSKFVPESLKNVNITDGVSIEANAFYDCSCLTNVTISSTRVQFIRDRAFGCCRSLKSMTIPPTVTFIGEKAFAFCNLTSVIIPKSVTFIGKEAFYYCLNLKIYCHADKKPEDWAADWNLTEEGNIFTKKKATVVWCYRGI